MRGAIVDGSYEELLVALVRRLVNGGGVGRSRYHTIHFRYYAIPFLAQTRSKGYSQHWTGTGKTT